MSIRILHEIMHAGTASVNCTLSLTLLWSLSFSSTSSTHCFHKPRRSFGSFYHLNTSNNKEPRIAKQECLWEAAEKKRHTDFHLLSHFSLQGELPCRNAALTPIAGSNDGPPIRLTTTANAIDAWNSSPSFYTSSTKPQFWQEREAVYRFLSPCHGPFPPHVKCC